MKYLTSLARSFGSAFALVMVGAIAVLMAAQSNTWSPTTGTVSGQQLTNNYNAAFTAIQTCNSGNSAPLNDVSLAAVKGQCWLDTSTTPNTVKMYDGTSWTTVGWLDASAHLWIANGGGGTGTIAAAGTTDLGTITNPVMSITGTTGITSFGSTAITGTRKYLNFTGILTLTHNASSLILPNNGSNITTAVGDTAIVEALGSGNWRMVAYQRASGIALSASANFTSTVSFNSVISPAALAANTADWNPAGLATANVIRFSCSSPISIQGIVAPVTDGQVLVLSNIGATNACKLTSQDAAEATPANRFALDRAVFIRPGRTLAIRYDLTTARWVLWQENTAQPSAAGAKNLRILNVANALGDTAPATPNNQNKIAFDEVTLEDASGGVVRIDTSYAYSCTVDITGSTFNASTGGIDTGAVAASTWYFHWVIYNPTTDVASCLDSIQTSFASVTKPSGFTFGARVGANRTDASANKCFYRVQQYNRVASYINTTANAGCSADNSLGPVQVAQGAGGTGANQLSPTTGASKQVTGNGFIAPTTAARVLMNGILTFNGNTCTFAQAAPNANYFGTQNGMGGTNNIQWPIFTGAGASQGWMNLETNSIQYWANGANTGGCAIFAFSWEDNL